MLIQQERYANLPLKSIELTSPWDLGGDGKAFYGFHPECEWYVTVQRICTKSRSMPRTAHG